MEIIRNNGKEKMTSSFIAEEDMKAYHISTTKIKTLWRDEAICMHSCIPYLETEAIGTVVVEEYVYEITIPKGTEVYCFDEEYRIIVTGETSKAIIGRMQTIRLDSPERQSEFRPGYTSTKIKFVSN